MRNRFLSPALLASCLALPLPGLAQVDDDVIAVKPLSMTTQVDGGQIVKGNFNGSVLEEQFVQRTSVWITQELAIGPRLDVRAGVGGLFWYATPSPVPNGAFSEVAPFVATAKFGPGITRADMEYRFGELERPMFTLQVGFFPYKYNSDARNLGEYLLRSGAYPGYLVTGGWNLISGAGYMMRGARLNMSLWDGKFQTEFLLPMEQDLPGINGDLSPALITSVRPVPGLELGAGASCHHCLPVKPSNTSPKVRIPSDGTYYGVGNGYVYENPNYVDSPDDSLRTDLSGSNPEYLIDTTNFYTFQGLKLMARASFDPKAYVPTGGLLGPEDLKVFGEIAVLGWKNYPFYYEKRSERMPVMVGVNLPTFRLLDVLSFQMEHYSSRLPNAVKFPSDKALPLPGSWGYDNAGNVTYDPNLMVRDHENVKDDDWKWSLYGRKEIVRGLRVYAQVANDYIRLPNEWGSVSSLPLTNANGDWYYLIRLELGI
jgi:hypothetical protein